MRRIGVVVNPIAGMGGRVGLKGTDGKVDEARARGAEPRAPDRAHEALERLQELAPDTEVLTYGGAMGADAVRAAGFEPVVVGEPAGEETTADDTRRAVRDLVANDVHLVLFVGGDGTAVDVAETLDELGDDTPVLGVPAGVKVYSEVFGVTPRAAGQVAASYTDTETAEVNDIDEDEYREGEVHTELRGVVRVPAADQRQASKQLGGGTVESLAEGVAREAQAGVTYVLGPGSTVGAVKDALGFEGTALGVDVWRDDAVLVEDGSEREILDALGDENVIVVSPIGGQGFVFGRGNQQLSPDVIRRCDLEVVASKRKLDDIGVLRVDTGDPELDDELRGWLQVRVGRFERRLMKVV
ncbi:ATP-NAD kinase family protein [Halorientalis brevis]|uniref:ATP-NAD kinase family protein n=1 Tax=Halorientalis brevis TaxID=1126241 RepID=A0ABD6CH75_9EURY|nr:ATP-NAD kinase family protein [Halorientalis brevis]